MRIPRQQKRSYTWRWTAALGGLAVLALALVLGLVISPTTDVQAATYSVNVTDSTLVGGTTGHADEADLVLDGTCDANAAAGNQCTLRAAIQEANNSAANDTITVPGAGQITVATALPAITDEDLTINGNASMVSAGAAMAGPLLAITADRVTVNNLVIDGEGLAVIGVGLAATTDDALLNTLTVRDFTGDGIRTTTGGQRNTVQTSSVTSNDGHGVLLDGGNHNRILGNSITNNGTGAPDSGIAVNNEDDLLIQGNTVSGNFDNQIFLNNLGATDEVDIFQNTIVVSSNGIEIAGGVAGHVDIGLTPANRNVFRGPLGPQEYYVINYSAADVNAENNDWNNYDTNGVDGVVCHDFLGAYTPPESDGNCLLLLPGNGIVDFIPFIGSPSPLSTPTPTPGAATSTPVPTSTSAAATSTPTATGTPPTSTPTTVATEDVTLAPGCNNEASTWPDNTDIETIAAAVDPASALDAIWYYVAATHSWLGYSPDVPADVNDLEDADRLEPLFFCVDRTATLSRPLV